MVCLVPGVAPPQAGRGIHCSKMFGSSESKLGLSECLDPVCRFARCENDLE